MAHPIDEADLRILRHCREGLLPLAPLRLELATGTLYRHVRKLLAQGLLERRGALYRTTTTGVEVLAASLTNLPASPLVKLYPPLRVVPTVEHRALLELILAAVAARQHGIGKDHHPSFAMVGKTLSGKTSLAKFACHMLGLDPALCLLDLSTETGRSLWTRRGPTGGTTFRREILDAPFVIFDEFLLADARVRALAGHFLSGRLNVPFENETLTIRPVPLVILNPRPGRTLTERTTFADPQLRRLILLDLDAITLPDLAAIGDGPLRAAEAHGPLAVPAPRHLAASRADLLGLIRQLLIPEAQAMADLDMLTLLCVGMTAFVPPAQALGVTLSAYCRVVRPLGWTVPDWPSVLAAWRGGAETAGLPAASPVLPARVSLRPKREVPMKRRDAIVPDLSLSVESQARLAWLAQEAGVPLDEAVEVLVRFYRLQRQEEVTLDQLEEIIELRDSLEVNDLSPADVRQYLADRAALEKAGCSVEDVPALKVALQAWEAQGRTPAEATALLLLDRELESLEVYTQDVANFVALHRRLRALGFDADAVDALASALERPGRRGIPAASLVRGIVGRVGLSIQTRAAQAALLSLRQECAALARHKSALEQTIDRMRAAQAWLHRERALLVGKLVALRRDPAALMGETKEGAAIPEVAADPSKPQSR